MYDVIKQLNYQSCLPHFDKLAFANLPCKADCVAYHVMLNAVSEKCEWIRAAISQFVKVVERYR